MGGGRGAQTVKNHVKEQNPAKLQGVFTPCFVQIAALPVVRGGIANYFADAGPPSLDPFLCRYLHDPFHRGRLGECS